MRVLAFDVASSTGWAVDGPGDGKVPICGTYRRQESPGNRGLTFLRFGEFCFDFAKLNKAEFIAYEAPLQGSGHNFHEHFLLWGLCAQVEMIAASLGVRSAPVNVQKVRAHFVGNGRCTKSAVMARCHQLGWKPKNFDEADSLAVWAWAKATYDKNFWPEAGPPLFGKRVAGAGV